MCSQVLLFRQHTCAGEGVEEVARARVRCAWGKFKELSAILTSRGASYHIKSTGREFLKGGVKVLGLLPEWAIFRDMWKGLHMGKRPTLA